MKVHTNLPIEDLSHTQLRTFRAWLSSARVLIKLTLPDGRVFEARKETHE